MTKAVIFDFDGVLFDVEHKRFKDLKTVLKRYELELNDSTYSDMLGKKTIEFVRQNFPELDKKDVEKIAEERRDLQYNELEGNKLMEGAAELLEFLKSKDYRLVVVTGSQRFIVEELLEMHELSKFFEVVITGEDYRSSKPDPECYKMALEKLDLKAEEAVIIEDAAHGITAAKRLGCRVFGLKSSFKGDELKDADKVFNNLSEIKEFFEKEK